MAIIYNIDEAVKRSDFGVLVENIQLVLDQTAEPFEKKSLINEYFLVRTTKNFEEKFRSGGRTMGEFKLADDMDATPLDDDGEGFAKAIGHVIWKNGFAVSKTALEDGDNAKIRNLSTQLIKGFYRGREYFARNMYGGGITGKYAYTRPNGAVKNFDCTTIDSVTGALDNPYKVPLFSAVHRLPENHLKKGSNVVVQSNKFAPIGGIDVSGTDPLAVEKVRDFLDHVRNKGKQLLGEDGKTQGYNYNKIIVPTSNYRLTKILKEAVKDDSTWTVIEDEYLDDLAAFAASELTFIIKSDEALTDTEGALWLDRVKLSIESFVDKNNGVNIWNGRARYGAGFISYRHAVLVTFKDLKKVTTLPGTVAGQTITDKATLCDRHGVLLSTNTYAPTATPTDWNDCFIGLTVAAHGKPVEVTNVVKTEEVSA